MKPAPPVMSTRSAMTCLLVALFELELDELEVVLGDDEAGADRCDAVRLQLAHRVAQGVAGLVLGFGDVGSGRRAGTEADKRLPGHGDILTGDSHRDSRRDSHRDSHRDSRRDSPWVSVR